MPIIWKSLFYLFILKLAILFPSNDNSLKIIQWRKDRTTQNRHCTTLPTHTKLGAIE